MNNYSKNSFSCDFRCQFAREVLSSRCSSSFGRRGDRTSTFGRGEPCRNPLPARADQLSGERVFCFPADPVTYSRKEGHCAQHPSHGRFTKGPRLMKDEARLISVNDPVASLASASYNRSPRAYGWIPAITGMLRSLVGSVIGCFYSPAWFGSKGRTMPGAKGLTILDDINSRQASPFARLTEEMSSAILCSLAELATPAAIGCERAPLLVTLPRLRNPLADDLDPNVVLPGRRASVAVLPLVGGRTRAANRGNDLGGGEFSKSLVEGHEGRIPDEKKCAMQKIELAGSVQCRHGCDVKTLSRLVAGSVREVRITQGRDYLTADFGLPFGIKVLRKNVRNFDEVADKAVAAFERIGPKRRKEVVTYILSSPHSTEEAIWCAGKPRRTGRKSISKQ